jgi:hypothetical protein
MKTETIGVTVYVPAPLPAPVAKNTLGAANVVPATAGTTLSSLWAFPTVPVSEQGEAAAFAHVAVVPVISEASRGNGVVPLNCVEVMETFHPNRPPLRSSTSNGIGYVIRLPGVPEKLYALATRVKKPGMIDPDTIGGVGVSEKDGVGMAVGVTVGVAVGMAVGVGVAAKVGVIAPGKRKPPPMSIMSSNALR